ncbi:hypothetical protein GCM10017673_54080 [Streptosporangium violaceochromogenes]|nr:hypothetical protein GCM10017673_54080 [Streptosporangium violaceochromogenes]
MTKGRDTPYQALRGHTVTRGHTEAPRSGHAPGSRGPPRPAPPARPPPEPEHRADAREEIRRTENPYGPDLPETEGWMYS